MRAPKRSLLNLRALSVIELLIVIALMALLAIILLPVFSNASERASMFKCQAQLRQLATAGSLYASERNGLLPERVYWRSSTQPLSQYSIMPYLNIPLRTPDEAPTLRNSVLTCPAIQKSKFRTVAEWNCNYSINQYATGSDSSSESDSWTRYVYNRGVPLRIGNVQNAARQAFFMDGTAVAEGDGSRYSAYQAPDRLTVRTNQAQEGWKTPFCHADSIQVVFMDGHIEAVSLKRAESELIGPTNPAPSQASESPRTNAFWGTTH